MPLDPAVAAGFPGQDPMGFVGPQIPWELKARLNYGGEAEANPIFDPFATALSAYGAGFPVLRSLGAATLGDVFANASGNPYLRGLGALAFGMYPNAASYPSSSSAGNLATTVGNTLGGPASKYATRVAKDVYRNGIR